MNKALFYFVSIVLAASSLVLILIGFSNEQPDEFLGILIAINVLSSIFLTIIEGKGIDEFLYLLLVGILAILLISMFIAIIVTLPYHYRTVTPVVTLLIIGTRFVCTTWPWAVFVLGYHKLKEAEEAKNPEEPKIAEDTPKQVDPAESK